MIYHYPAKFGNYRHSDNGNVMVLICGMISQDHVTQEPCVPSDIVAT